MTPNQLKENFLKANTGDKKAYNIFLLEVQKLALRYITYKISDQSIREDILQEILISIHQARHTFDPKKEINPWLYAIFNYRTLDHLRKIYKNLEDTVEIFPESSQTENYVTKHIETNESLDKALNCLNEKQRKILTLSKAQGYTSAEIALEMGLTVSAVKVTIHRAIQKIRKTK
jgi:RNA polymerase sigma-70 factor (ECF subfamily)